MGCRTKNGFTLIELLTVIAIIGILASMVIVGLGRAMEKAKVARVTNLLRQMQTALTEYFTGHRETYPAIYGYLKQPYSATLSDANQYNLIPYTVPINKFRADDWYDEFSEARGYDTNQDGLIDVLEYSPLGTKVGTEYTFSETLISNLPRSPVGAERTDRRPLVYVPVKASQAQKVAKYYYRLALEEGLEEEGLNARIWDSSAPELQGLRFPPPRYDAFAIISMGPAEDTGGVVPGPATGEPDESSPNIYHIRALRAFFLASRDANDNGQLDFDFRNRTGSGEDNDAATYEAKGLSGKLNLLPDGTPGYGPIILVVQ